MMKKDEFVKLILVTESFYPGRFKNDEMIATTWWEILKDYDFALCNKNLKNHVKVSEWPPTIANLIKGHKDTSRTYSDKLVDNIDNVKTVEDYIKEIEERTGMKVIE